MALHEERKLKKKLSKVEKDAYDKKVNTLERNLTSAEHINNTLSKQVAAINAKLNMSRNLGPPEGQPFPLNRNQTL